MGGGVKLPDKKDLPSEMGGRVGDPPRGKGIVGGSDVRQDRPVAHEEEPPRERKERKERKEKIEE